MDFKENGSNSHVQFEILGTSFSETFGKDVKRVRDMYTRNSLTPAHTHTQTHTHTHPVTAANTAPHSISYLNVLLISVSVFGDVVLEFLCNYLQL